MRYEDVLRRVAENLRDLRRASNVTQEGLAHEAGVSVRALASLERGQTPSPSLVLLHSVAEAVGVDVAKLFEPRRAGPRPAPLRPGRKPTRQKKQM